MLNMFVEKLRRENLPMEDLALLSAELRPPSRVAINRDIVECEASSNYLYVLLEGWACKSRSMRNGKRQIVQVHLPGDICNLDSLSHQPSTCNVGAITTCQVTAISVESLNMLIDQRSAISRAFWSLMWDENLALTNRIASLGSHSAEQRVAYLLLDLFTRSEMLQQAPADTLHLPMNQNDIADAVGLSAVHVNRTLGNLRDQGMIGSKGRMFTILDRAKLRACAMTSVRLVREPAMGLIDISPGLSPQP